MRRIKASPKSVTIRKNLSKVHAIAWWEKGYEEPIYLGTQIYFMEDAWFLVAQTISRITFFKDAKSQGGVETKVTFLIQPVCLSGVVAACLAYIWIVYLGEFAIAFLLS